MGKHSLRHTPDATLSDTTQPPPGGNGWLTPEQVAAAEKLIAETNRKNVEDAAAQIAARRYKHGG